MTSNNCPSCGASNNHFATKCDFCDTPLKAAPTDAITNEELISVINLWIGRFIDDGTLKLEYNGKERDYRPEELEGIVNQYLGILQLRAMRDSQLHSLYVELTEKFRIKKKEKRKETRLIWIGAIVFIVVVVVFLVLENKFKS